MLADGLSLVEGSVLDNASIVSGTSFPLQASIGELFFRSDLGTLSVHNGNSWVTIGSAAAGSLTGTTIASNVVSSSLTSVGTLTTLSVSGRTNLTSYTEQTSAATSAATQNIDCALGTIFPITLSTSITSLTFSNLPASGKALSISLFVTQSGAGSRTIAWPASVKWAGGTTPALTTAVGKTDVISLVTFDAGVTWFGFVGGLNF